MRFSLRRSGFTRWPLVPAIALLTAALAPTPATATTGSVAGVASGNLAAVSCPTATLCYAVGDDRHGHAVFDTLVGGRQTRSQRPSGMQELIGVSCPSRSYCPMTGDDSHGDVAIQAFSHGGFSRPIKPGFEAWRVSCPSVGECVIAGFADGAQPALAAADVIAGKVGRVHERALGNPVTSTAIYGLSCVSMSACEAVGTADVTTSAGIGSVYSEIGAGGRISRVHVLKSNTDPALEDGITCVNSTCYLGATTQAQELLLSVPIGGSSLTQVAVLTMLPAYIACEHGLSLCIVAGSGNGAVPALQTLVNGQPQPEQDLPQLQSRDALVSFTAVAMGSAGNFVALATEAESASTQIVTGTP